VKLAISNIAWAAAHDAEMYAFLQETGYTGLEIAPTRIFPVNPYDSLSEAAVFSRTLKEKYSLQVCSMQSLWFGKTEKLFGSDEERSLLLNYTKQAIDFASAIGCGNLVFGSPKNRITDENSSMDKAVSFFRALGEYAHEKKCVLAMEANPVIYGTNYINTTDEALALVREVESPGFKVNFDLGTSIYNGEGLEKLSRSLNLIHHIHISEPYLAKIEKRDIHRELSSILSREHYNGFVSIEMKNLEDTAEVQSVLRYVKEVFDDN
jgi:sugar phosphate isomerase/epimerase